VDKYKRPADKIQSATPSAYGKNNPAIKNRMNIFAQRKNLNSVHSLKAYAEKTVIGFLAFRIKVRKQKQTQANLKVVIKMTAKEIMEMAKAEGYDITLTEAEMMIRIKEKEINGEELTMEELELVAGGLDVKAFFKKLGKAIWTNGIKTAANTAINYFGKVPGKLATTGKSLGNAVSAALNGDGAEAIHHTINAVKGAATTLLTLSPKGIAVVAVEGFTRGVIKDMAK